MLRDLRHAVRILVRNPGFAATAALLMACGIAACTAVFSLVYTLLLRPLAVPRAEDIVSIYGVSQEKGTLRAVSTPDYRDLATRTDVFDDIGAYVRRPILVELGNESERAVAELSTGNYHSLLGVHPAIGRMLRAEDDRAGAPRVIVLSESFWRRRFAGPEALGRVLHVNGVAYEIVGVAPASFTGVLVDWYAAPDVWLPLSQYGGISKRLGRLAPDTKRDFPWLQLTARLRSGVSIAGATAVLQRQAEELARAYPDTNKDVTFTATPTSHARIWPGRRRVVVNFAAVLLVIVAAMLVIAVLNVANLLLARLTTRHREISIRLAIGADRVSLARQLLLESIVLSGVATLASVPLSVLLTWIISRMDLPFFVIGRALDLSPDWRVFAAVAGLCAACGLLLGLAPAWHGWRSDVRSGLTSAPSSARRTIFGMWDVRHWLAALQIAICLTLAVGSGLLGKRLLSLMRVDCGFATEGVTLFNVETYILDYSHEQNAALYGELLARVRRMPGVEAAALAFKVLPSPILGTNTIAVPDAEDPHARGFAAGYNVVSSGYFQTVRMPLVAGRAFDDRDGNAAPSRFVILNETAARRLWHDPARAIGQHVRLIDEQKRETNREVIGVVRNAVYGELDESPMPYLFLPVDRSWDGMLTLHVRGGPRQPGQLIADVRRELRLLDHSLAFSAVLTLDQYVATRLAAPALAARLAITGSVVSVALAIIGLYAVLAYLVAQRRTELAIRMSIGAAPREIVSLVVGFGLKIVLAGAALGLAGSFFAMRVIATQLGGVDIHDPLVYASMLTLVLFAALGACLLPARRAARLDPWAILRR